jgi:hypothetical protein
MAAFGEGARRVTKMEFSVRVRSFRDDFYHTWAKKDLIKPNSDK